MNRVECPNCGSALDTQSATVSVSCRKCGFQSSFMAMIAAPYETYGISHDPFAPDGALELRRPVLKLGSMVSIEDFVEEA